MKIKPVLPGMWRKPEWKPSGWRWRQRMLRRRAVRAVVKLDGLFPLSFVPESSSARRTA